MNGVGKRPGWAWIFILEGLFTFLFGLTAYFTLPDSPSHCKFFSEEERAYVIAKLKEDGSHNNDDSDKFSWREVGMAFTLPQLWILAVVLFFNGDCQLSLRIKRVLTIVCRDTGLCIGVVSFNPRTYGNSL